LAVKAAIQNLIVVAKSYFSVSKIATCAALAMAWLNQYAKQNAPSHTIVAKAKQKH
jgi:hypothetical protein